MTIGSLDRNAPGGPTEHAHAQPLQRKLITVGKLSQLGDAINIPSRSAVATTESSTVVAFLAIEGRNGTLIAGLGVDLGAS